MLNIWDDKVACVSPEGASLSDFGKDATLTVPKNQWAHIAWQCSPSTGLMTFINGVLAAQTGFKPSWNTSSGNLCFGGTVDMQQGDFYHLNGSISQLLFRAGATVEQYPAGGFTPPPNLTAEANGKTDAVYLMQHGFVNLKQSPGCLVLESNT